jgi:hypothetical protein
MNDQDFEYVPDGPFDSSQVELNESFIDFGSILVPKSIPDMTVRVEVEETSARLVAVSLEVENSILQISAFSAPKTMPIWNEVADQLYDSLISQGAAAERTEGSFGVSILATMPATDEPQMPERQLKFFGSDGPRWFLRGILSGKALQDDATAVVLDNVFRQLVVNRGLEALPPRELLPLVMPAGNVVPPRSV